MSSGAMDNLLEKLRAAQPQTRDQRDRRRHARLKDRHQVRSASGQKTPELDDIRKLDTGLDSHTTDKTTGTGSEDDNLLSPTSSPLPSSDGDTIRKVSNRCLRLFVESAGNSDFLHGPGTYDKTESALHNELMRFKLWASNIGVFADVHASLDFRLREAPDIAELFLRQLDTIEERLEQALQMSLYLGSDNEAESSGHERPYQCPECGRMFKSPSDTDRHLEAAHSMYHTGNYGPRGDSFDTEDSFDTWSKTELLQSIHESIDWLHRLSNMVRKASFNHQNKRADDFMLRDEHGQRSNELTNSFLEGLTQLYQFYIRTHAAGVGEKLAQRLVQTMIIRHRRVLYRRARRKVWNLEQVDYSPRKLAQESRRSRRSLRAPATTVLSGERKPVLPQPTAQTEVAASRITATTLDVNIARKAVAQSEVSKATSNSLIVSDRVLVPPRPAAAKSGMDFACDYCGLLLQARQASNVAIWAKHVRKDLDPYVCVFDECNTPTEIYSSSREWLSHMRSQHRMRWHCFATSHEPFFFQSPDDLEKHLREAHAGQLRSEEISFLVENSSHPSLSVMEHCPFCQETAENTEEHVARHLIQFALRSLPWPEDCYSSCHSSQSSHSAHSEGSASSAETNRDQDGMREVRKTDWDAWEKEFRAEEIKRLSLHSQLDDDEPPLTGESSNEVGLHDFLSPDYDATEDELLEPFRKRANPGEAKNRSLETQLSEREASVRKLIKEEAAFVRDLNVLVEIYEGTSQTVPELDQTKAGRLFRNLDQVTTLHEEFLKDLRTAVQPDGKGTKTSFPHDNSLSSSAVTPKSIGTILLENSRKLGPAHEAYSATHQDAVSLWQSIREAPTVQVWINECHQVSSDLTNCNFDDLLELSNKRCRREYYITWLNRLLSQTPYEHPDKEQLLTALAFHRASVSRAESTIRGAAENSNKKQLLAGRVRKDIVQRVLEHGDSASGSSLLSRVFKSQDYTELESPDDADFKALCERFQDDHGKLEVTHQDLEHYHEQVKKYFHKFRRLASQIELAMCMYPGPHPEIESKWIQFNLSFCLSLKDDLFLEYINKFHEKVLEPIRALLQMHSKSILLIDHRRNRRRKFEKYNLLKRRGKKTDDQLVSTAEEYEAIDSALRQELPLMHNLVINLMKLLTEQLVLVEADRFSGWTAFWTAEFQRLAGRTDTPRWGDITAEFIREFGFIEEQIEGFGIISGSSQTRRGNLLTEEISLPLRPASPPHAAGTPRPVYFSPTSPKSAGRTMFYRDYYNDLKPRYDALHGVLPSAVNENDEDDPGPSKPEHNILGIFISRGYKPLWSATCLSEFNRKTTSHESGYPFLTYKAGEIFDVVAEKDELWLAVNREDPNSEFGWIWSKHFARLQDPSN